MTTYEVLRGDVKRFGKNSYLEVTRQRLVTHGTQTEFLVVTRGFFDPDGTRYWTRLVTIPDDKELKAWLRRSLEEM